MSSQWSNMYNVFNGRTFNNKMTITDIVKFLKTEQKQHEDDKEEQELIDVFTKKIDLDSDDDCEMVDVDNDCVMIDAF